MDLVERKTMNADSMMFRRISAVLIGCGAGVLMALILLLLFQNSAFRVNSGSFLFIAAAAAVMPLCLDVLRVRGIEPEIAEAVMIVLSAVICIGYVSASAGNELAHQYMMQAVVLVHCLALLVYILQWALHFLRKQV